MTGRTIQAALALLLPGLLAGCGGGGSVSTADVASIYSDNVNAYSALSSAVVPSSSSTGMTVTPDATVKAATGSATFSGFASLLAGPPDSRIALVSPATITTDFDNSKVSGSASNFIGQTANVTTNTYISSPASYSGQILLNGCIGATCAGGTNNLTANASGTLSGDGNKIVVNQTVSGNFYGSDASAIDLSGASAGNTVNGTAVTSSLDFVGTKQ